MEKSKGRSDVAAAIIETANVEDGALPTAIMYSLRLGWEDTLEYLNLLTENTLLRYDEKKQRYWATDKGLKFLNLYKDVGVLFKRIAMA